MFETQYFKDLYSPDSLIDGDFNAKEHARYLHSLFHLMELEVKSLIDYGFGKANLLKAVNKCFQAKKITAIDVSKLCCKKLTAKKWAKNIKVQNLQIADFNSNQKFDLGICNSVLQYVEDKNLEKSIQVMAKNTKYLYMHVPTSEDYKIFQSNLDFEDAYAIKRPKKTYLKLLGKYFTFVSYGLLESKLDKELETPFIDSIYRFP